MKLLAAGVCSKGGLKVWLPGRCLLPEGSLLPRWCHAPFWFLNTWICNLLLGVSAPRVGVCPGGCASQHALNLQIAPSDQNDSQTGVKDILCKLRLWAIITKRLCTEVLVDVGLRLRRPKTNKILHIFMAPVTHGTLQDWYTLKIGLSKGNVGSIPLSIAITGYSGWLRLLTRSQLNWLRQHSLFHQNHKNLWDNGGHSLLIITRQLPSKASN